MSVQNDINKYCEIININGIEYKAIHDTDNKKKFVISLKDNADNVLKFVHSMSIADVEFNGEKMKCQIDASPYPIGNIYEIWLTKF